ncbi:MAG TPA: 2-phospho-L-lactate guanylyltransferase [Methanothrix sp.]|nr:2-phospho-L-lactate guanylyltransferase [Methanothrix sp.]
MQIPGVNRPHLIVVPFKLNGAKSRLAPALTPEQRRALAFAMLRDVLRTVSPFGRVTVLSRPGLKREEIWPDGAACEAEICESELDLNDAINAFLEDQAAMGWPCDILIVMADLALLGGRDVEGILSAEGDVVLCPGRGGGTNMIMIRSPSFRTCYTGVSFPKHIASAQQAGLKAAVFESFRAGCDIDLPGDLLELRLHGSGEARALLERWGACWEENGS